MAEILDVATIFTPRERIGLALLQLTDSYNRSFVSKSRMPMSWFGLSYPHHSGGVMQVMINSPPKDEADTFRPFMRSQLVDVRTRAVQGEETIELVSDSEAVVSTSLSHEAADGVSLMAQRLEAVLGRLTMDDGTLTKWIERDGR
jgi:hypothetical protein